jgi:hypothetical protein
MMLEFRETLLAQIVMILVAEIVGRYLKSHKNTPNTYLMNWHLYWQHNILHYWFRIYNRGRSRKWSQPVCEHVISLKKSYIRAYASTLIQLLAFNSHMAPCRTKKYMWADHHTLISTCYPIWKLKELYIVEIIYKAECYSHLYIILSSHQ